MAGSLKLLVWALLGAAGFAAPASACEPIASGASGASGATSKDAGGRSVALVNINGQGPFRFIIDTGANRSVLSQSLASRLGLEDAGEGVVHSIDGVSPARLVKIDSLSFGALQLSSGETPVLDGPMLDGEHGLLGVDGMAGRLLHVDFTKRCVGIYEGAVEVPVEDWLAVPARVRFGSLLMVEGQIQGVKVNVLIDTGSDTSLANTKFREALRNVAARMIHFRGDRAFTYGRPVLLDESVWTPSLRLGRTVIDGVNAFIGDFHIFEIWGLQDEPTMLIGMDVLTRSQEMVIDYARGIVHFRRKPGGGAESEPWR